MRSINPAPLHNEYAREGRALQERLRLLLESAGGSSPLPPGWQVTAEPRKGAAHVSWEGARIPAPGLGGPEGPGQRARARGKAESQACQVAEFLLGLGWQVNAIEVDAIAPGCCTRRPGTGQDEHTVVSVVSVQLP